MVLPDIDFTGYLRSLSQQYARWWNLYTLTDATHQLKIKNERMGSLFGFELMVERVEERDRDPQESPNLQETQKKVERLPVLEGLRKYAPEHVLLVGRSR